MDGRETPTGWVVLGCVSLVVLAGPAWMIITAAIIQISPTLGGFADLVEGGGEALPPRLRWWIGGALGAATLAALLPLFGVLYLGVRAALGLIHRRQRAERERYDALTRDEAVIRDPRWGPGGTHDR